MKRYLLFIYGLYYPCGGWNDLAGCFDTLEEAQKAASNREKYLYDYHIVDLQVLKPIEGDYLLAVAETP